MSDARGEVVFRLAVGAALMIGAANAYVYVFYAPDRIDDLSAMAGTRVPPEELSLPVRTIVISSDAMPESFDPTSSDPAVDPNGWKNKITAVQNQGACRADWAFACVSVLADRWNISRDAKLELSAQYLLDATASSDRFPECSSGGKCDCGESADEGMRILRDRGTVPADCVPYRGGRHPRCPVPNCSYADATEHVYCTRNGTGGLFSPDKSRPIEFPKVKFAEVYRLPALDVEAMREEIRTFGPIVAVMELRSDFPRGPIKKADFVYSSSPTSFVVGMHAVKIVGWGTSSRPYWVVQNSWGDKWGRKGFVRVLRGSNECNIEGRCYAGLVQTASA